MVNVSAIDSGPPYRTLLIEAESLLRSVLARFIHGLDGFRLLADFGEIDLARDACKRLQPELVIIDIDFAPEESIRFIELLVEESPRMNVLVLSGSIEPEIWFRLANTKIRGFVAKKEPVDSLEEAMREIVAGRTYLPAAFLRGCDLYRTRQVQNDGQLSQTEIAILRRVAAGWTSRQIAAELRLSPRSVETYRSRLMRKAGVANAAALIQYAFRSGLAQKALLENR